MSEDATGSGLGDLGGSTGTGVAGGSSGRGVGGGAGALGVVPNGGSSRLGRLVSGLPLPVHDHETPSTGGELDAYLPAGTAIPPATHLTSADASVAIVEAPTGTFDLQAAPTVDLSDYYTRGEADAAFLTPTEGDALFLTAAEGGAAYAAVDHSHPSQQSAPWRFQNVATIADPGDGNFRSNTGVLATATTLALSRTTQEGYETPSTGYGVVGGDTIYVQDRDDNTKWVRFLVLEPLVRFAGYVTSAVELIGSAGTITDSQICQLTFTLAGGGGGGGGDALTEAEGDARYEPLDSAYTKTEADARYEPLDSAFTKAEADTRFATPTDVNSAVSTHAALADPHPGYLTQTEGDARYVELAGDTTTGGLTVGGALGVSGVVTVGGTAQPKITVASSAPGSPATGDLWVW